jgi:hypothetical protein
MNGMNVLIFRENRYQVKKLKSKTRKFIFRNYEITKQEIQVNVKCDIIIVSIFATIIMYFNDFHGNGCIISASTELVSS